MKTCDEYRQAVMADPAFDDEHVERCPDCRAYRERVFALDRRIEEALSIPVPPLAMPELPDIDTGNTVALPKRRRKPMTWLALAAGVVAAAVLGFRMLGSGLDQPSLEAEILAHLDHEPYALRVTDEPVAESRLARVVPGRLAQLDHSAGLITYAQSCVINGHRVPHLVIQGERGPVTILLMPEETVTAAKSITGATVEGVILPVGEGSVAIIGEKGENLERIETNVKNSITWDT